MNWLQWIPNFFKGMIEVLRELQQMAGGHKRGQLVFWVSFVLGVLAFLLVLALAFSPAYDSVNSALSHFNINLSHVDVNIPSSIFVNLLLSLLVTLIACAFLLGVAGVIGAFLGMLTNVMFASPFRLRLDEIFSELMPLLRSAKQTELLNETNNRLVVDAEALYTRWQKSRINKFVRWGIIRKRREPK